MFTARQVRSVMRRRRTGGGYARMPRRKGIRIKPFRGGIFRVAAARRIPKARFNPFRGTTFKTLVGRRR